MRRKSVDRGSGKRRKSLQNSSLEMAEAALAVAYPSSLRHPVVGIPTTISEHDFYATLANHFERDDVNLPGFAKFFAAHTATATTQESTGLTATEVDAMLLNNNGALGVDAETPKERLETGEEATETNAMIKTPKAAFEEKDKAGSKAAHSKEMIVVRSQEKHSVIGERIKSIVYGGLDGIITTFAVVAGATGGHLGTDVILILGVSNMFADAVSMGMGDAISAKAENEMILKEREREAWEFEYYPEGEKEEMVEIYTARGLAEDKARLVVDSMASNDDNGKFFVDQMMTDELGMELPDEDEDVWASGLVTFSSFVFFGVFPLLAYICLDQTDTNQDTLFIIACALTGLMLFILGVVKSQFTKQLWYLAGAEILALGGFTATVSYGIGALVAEIV